MQVLMKGQEHRQTGFSLIEVIILLAVLVTVIALLVPSTVQQLTAGRRNSTLDEMDELKVAMIGDSDLKSQGVRSDFGFLGDMGNMPVGALPSDLDELVVQGAQPAYAFNSSLRVGAGWKGPYLTLVAGGDTASHRKDAFGNDYTYDDTDYTNGQGQAVDGKLVTLGADGVAGGTGVDEDVTVEVLKAETAATVNGFVFDGGGAPINGGQMDINYPATGTLTSSTATSDATGFYQFTNIPFGMRSVTIGPRLTLVAGSVSAFGGAITYVRSGGVTGTSFSLDIGTAGTDRLVVVFLGNEGTEQPATQVTIDGKNANLVRKAHNIQGADNHQEMWYADEDDLGTSAGTVTIAFTGGDTGWAIHAHLYTGVIQTGPDGSWFNDTAVAQTTIPVTGVNVPANGLVVMGAGHGSAGTATGWTAPLTERTDGPNPASGVLATASAIETSAQTGKTYTSTMSVSFNRGTGIVAVFAEGIDYRHVQFSVENSSGSAVTVRSLAATYSVTAFYDEIRWAGTTVYNCPADGPAGASGATLTFGSDQTVAALSGVSPTVVAVASSVTQVADITLQGGGTQAQIELRLFRDGASPCPSGSIVDMRGANFTDVTLRDPANAIIGQFSFTVP